MAIYLVKIQQMRLEEITIKVAAAGRYKAGTVALGLARSLKQKLWTSTDQTDDLVVNTTTKQEHYYEAT